MDEQRCSTCGAVSTASKNFCADCGASFTSDAAKIRALVDDRISSRLRDRSLVEVETAQAVAERVSGWTKLFGAFVGIPLSLLAGYLAFVGYDWKKSIDSAKAEYAEQIKATKDDLNEAGQLARTARDEAGQMQSEVAELRKALDSTQLAGLRTDIERLNSRVSGIEQQFKVNPAGISTDLNKRFTEWLTGFAAYLERSGFDTKRSPAEIMVEGNDNNSYYSITEHKVVVGKPFATAAAASGDPSLLLWPYVQHVLATDNAAAFQATGDTLAVLTNAVPDYFVASYRDDPRIGVGTIVPGRQKGDPLRNLSNDFRFEGRSEPHELGEVWGGVFWRLRSDVGQEAADQVLRVVWRQLRNESGPAFAKRLVTEVERLRGARSAASLRADIERRGLKPAP